jgi:toxin-antitoxin system PIN domain toxin
MTSFFPDPNVWLALSVAGHLHSAEAWGWLNGVPRNCRLSFVRFTQIGLLRLLSSDTVMGSQTLALEKAWSVYDRWMEDPRVEFNPEPRDLEGVFRATTSPFGGKAASKWVGDCYLLAYAKITKSTLVTFDPALLSLARSEGCAVIRPGQT